MSGLAGIFNGATGSTAATGNYTQPATNPNAGTTNISSFIGPGGGSQGVGNAPGATGGSGGNADSSQWGPTSNGNALTGEFISSNNPSMNPLFYEQAANTATAQAANYYNQGQAAMNVNAPTINNPNGATSRAQLAQTNQNFNALNGTLANTINGGGANAGQAAQQAGLNQGIAAQMAAAHSGRGGVGGYNLGNALAGQQTGQLSDLSLASAGAQARGSQINAAQGGLGSSLNAQGTMNLAQNATQQTQAEQQAALSQNQQQQNQAQALALYNQSLGEQGTYLNAVNAYGQQAAATQGENISQQQINNAQTNQMIGTGAQIGGAALTGLALLA